MLHPGGDVGSVRNVFEDPRERARAIGVFAAMFGISMALGPVLGGALVSAISWRAVFVVAVPFALAAIALAARFVPESRAPRPRRIDPVGQLLMIAGLATLTYAVIEGGRTGFDHAEIVSLLVLALGCFAALVPYELRRREPLARDALLHQRPVRRRQRDRRMPVRGTWRILVPEHALPPGRARTISPVQAGLYMLPTATMMTIVAPISGRMVGRYGSRPSMVTGGLAVAVSGLMLTRLAPDTPTPFLLAAYAAFGLGFALVSPPIANTAVSGMPRPRLASRPRSQPPVAKSASRSAWPSSGPSRRAASAASPAPRSRRPCGPPGGPWRPWDSPSRHWAT